MYKATGLGMLDVPASWKSNFHPFNISCTRTTTTIPFVYHTLNFNVLRLVSAVTTDGAEGRSKVSNAVSLSRS